MSIELPPGYSWRHAQFTDASEVVDLFNLHWRETVGFEKDAEADLLNEWRMPGFDLASDSLVINAPDGRIAAYGDLWDRGEPHVRYMTYLAIDPQHNHLAPSVLKWMAKRGREMMSRAPAGTRVYLWHTSPASDQQRISLLEREGFVHIRCSQVLQIDLSEKPAAPMTPEGFVIRKVVPGEDEANAFETLRVAFMDHYGALMESPQQYYERMVQQIHRDPHFDPSLFFAADDGETLAGICLAFPRTETDPSLGWVNMLGVRREQRRQGLGLTLLLHVLNEMHRRGLRGAGLSVDTQSLTGANRLYANAGMHLKWQLNKYEKELRPGVELANTGQG